MSDAGGNEGLVGVIAAAAASLTTFLGTYLPAVRGLRSNQEDQKARLDTFSLRLDAVEGRPTQPTLPPDLADLRERVASLEADMRELEPLIRDAATRGEIAEMAAAFGKKFERISEALGYVKGRIQSAMGGIADG